MWSAGSERSGHPQPPTYNSLGLMEAFNEPVWVEWHAARCGTQSSLQPREPSTSLWQGLHSYGKSHTVPPVTWSTEAGSHSKSEGGAGDFIWKPPLGFEWHAAHYVAVVIHANLSAWLKCSFVPSLRPRTQKFLKWQCSHSKNLGIYCVKLMNMIIFSFMIIETSFSWLKLWKK